MPSIVMWNYFLKMLLIFNLNAIFMNIYTWEIYFKNDLIAIYSKRLLLIVIEKLRAMDINFRSLSIDIFMIAFEWYRDEFNSMHNVHYTLELLPIPINIIDRITLIISFYTNQIESLSTSFVINREIQSNVYQIFDTYYKPQDRKTHYIWMNDWCIFNQLLTLYH